MLSKKTNITNVWVFICVFFHKGGWHVGPVCESTFLGFHPGEVASTEGFCGRRPLVLCADAGRGEHPSRRSWRAPWLGWNIGNFTANRDVKISNSSFFFVEASKSKQSKHLVKCYWIRKDILWWGCLLTFRAYKKVIACLVGAYVP